MDPLSARWVKGTKQSGGLFFFFCSSFFLGVHRNWKCLPFSYIYRCLLLITTVETVTWELNCSKSCNLCSCSPRLHHWSWKWERWCLAFVRKSEKSSQVLFYTIYCSSVFEVNSRGWLLLLVKNQKFWLKKCVIFCTEERGVWGRQVPHRSGCRRLWELR